MLNVRRDLTYLPAVIFRKQIKQNVQITKRYVVLINLCSFPVTRTETRKNNVFTQVKNSV
jgi:hypothetical protein